MGKLKEMHVWWTEFGPPEIRVFSVAPPTFADLERMAAAGPGDAFKLAPGQYACAVKLADDNTKYKCEDFRPVPVGKVR